jgi:hypothetical protein
LPVIHPEPWTQAIVTAEMCATPRSGRDVCHTAQRLQPPDHFLHGLRRQLHHFEDGLFQSLDPRAHVLDFVQTVP